MINSAELLNTITNFSEIRETSLNNDISIDKTFIIDDTFPNEMDTILKNIESQTTSNNDLPLNIDSTIDLTSDISDINTITSSEETIKDNTLELNLSDKDIKDNTLELNLSDKDIKDNTLELNLSDKDIKDNNYDLSFNSDLKHINPPLNLDTINTSILNIDNNIDTNINDNNFSNMSSLDNHLNINTSEIKENLKIRTNFSDSVKYALYTKTNIENNINTFINKDKSFNIDTEIVSSETLFNDNNAELTLIESNNLENFSNIDDNSDLIFDDANNLLSNKNDFKLIDTELENVEPENLSKDVLNQIKKGIDENSTPRHVQIMLKPAALGKVNVDIKFINGSMSVNIYVDNSSTEEILKSNLTQLTDAINPNSEFTLSTINIIQRRDEVTRKRNDFSNKSLLSNLSNLNNTVTKNAIHFI